MVMMMMMTEEMIILLLNDNIVVECMIYILSRLFCTGIVVLCDTC
jgi:hypothetical protein